MIYGVTAFGLSRGLAISQKEAQEYLLRFFARHPKVKAYLDRYGRRRARARATSRTLLGRRRYLPELRSGNPNLRGFGERVATNAPIQGTAADLIKIAMVRMAAGHRRRAACRAACCCRCTTSCCSRGRPAEMEALEALAVEVMESAMDLSVPLKVDVKVGPDWAAV